jgi:hypothetical protein
MTSIRRFMGAVGFVVMLALLSAPLGAQNPQQTASDFYLAYRAAFDKARKVEELFPFMSKDTRAEVEATPAAERGKMFELMKMMGALTQVKVLKEAKTPTGATLTVDALDPEKKKTTGTIEVLREGGVWKLGSENWSSSF